MCQSSILISYKILLTISINTQKANTPSRINYIRRTSRVTERQKYGEQITDVGTLIENHIDDPRRPVI